ncbi:hypothetical protein GCM10010345_79530 [Streptomyces canarius]|uniref:Alcohol dehydrogenase-like C-terminal domain-containing protein n=1 Tax=Streptomyces canarius TaxID=285453 RepID=A0ABQ3D7N8_9ACTN|nr:hypothetical protein GCM10010345_79530 [Streptomyces canarius]
MQGTGAEEHRSAGGGTAQNGRDREADETGEEGGPAAPQVGDAPAQEQQSAEGKGSVRVRYDDAAPPDLRALGAATTVVAVDTDAGKLETARRLGADEALLSGATRRSRASGTPDMVGVDPTLRIAAQVARVLGHLSGYPQLGLPHRTDGCDHARPAEDDRGAGRALPPQRANEAYQLLHDGRIQGRVVIRPGHPAGRTGHGPPSPSRRATCR